MSHAETPGARLKRLRLRSWRRGTREMDLVLGPFADTELASLADDELAVYDALLSENDHDIYGWITGRGTPPQHYANLVARIAAHAGAGA